MEQKRCPTDGVSLIEINRSGVMIDVCPECKGVWLDRGELEKIVRVTRELELEFGGASASPPQNLDHLRRDRDEDDRRYTDPRRSKDSDEWDDEDRRKRKKSGFGRLLDIFD
jgi:uncharacterized protein